MQEPKENIGFFCNKECLKKAGRLKTYLKVPLEKFVGKYIKVGFPITKESERKEHMWVFVKEITKDDNLLGILENDPVYVNYIENGDPVEVSRDKIELVQKSGSDKFLSEEDLMKEGNNES